MRLLNEEEPRTRVEMTPIMDVIFLLLVFFVYSFMTMTVQRGLKVELPRAEGTVQRGETIQLVLSPSDEILLDGRTPLTLETAVEAVALRFQTLGVPVVIRADRQSHAGVALELLAALRAKGVSKVTYQVEKER